MQLRLLALTGLLVLPSLAAAQAPLPNPYQLPASRFTFTPFVGAQVPYGTGSLMFVTGSSVVWDVQEQRAGGPLMGAEVEARVRGPVSVLGSLAYANSGDTEVTLASREGEVQQWRVDGPETWMGRVALAYRLPEPDPDRRRFHPAGFLVAGPAVVRLDYDGDDVLAGLSDASTHWGLNLGFHAATLLGSPRLALHFGLEDFLTFWDTGSLARRDQVLLGAIVEDPGVVRYGYTHSNIVTLRAGLSLRF